MAKLKHKGFGRFSMCMCVGFQRGHLKRSHCQHIQYKPYFRPLFLEMHLRMKRFSELYENVFL